MNLIPGAIYEHILTGRLYRVLRTDLVLKCPKTREWHEAVEYEPYQKLDRGYVRVQKDFLKRFKEAKSAESTESHTSQAWTEQNFIMLIEGRWMLEVSALKSGEGEEKVLDVPHKIVSDTGREITGERFIFLQYDAERDRRIYRSDIGTQVFQLDQPTGFHLTRSTDSDLGMAIFASRIS